MAQFSIQSGILTSPREEFTPRRRSATVGRSFTNPSTIDRSATGLYFADMKAVSIQVSLNPELAEFARADSRSGAFDSVGDYVRDLIRRRREAQIAADVALLQSAIQGAPAGDPTESDYQDIYRSAKALRRRR